MIEFELSSKQISFLKREYVDNDLVKKVLSTEVKNFFQIDEDTYIDFMCYIEDKSGYLMGKDYEATTKTTMLESIMDDIYHQTTEKGYYYDENGERHEVGPSFEDWPGMARVVSPIPLCNACKKSDFDNNMDLTLCKAYEKIPKKYLKAKKYDCPYFDNRNNGWYQLIKDKVEKAQNGRDDKA